MNSNGCFMTSKVDTSKLANDISTLCKDLNEHKPITKQTAELAKSLFEALALPDDEIKNLTQDYTRHSNYTNLKYDATIDERKTWLQGKASSLANLVATETCERIPLFHRLSALKNYILSGCKSDAAVSSCDLLKKTFNPETREYLQTALKKKATLDSNYGRTLSTVGGLVMRVLPTLVSSDRKLAHSIERAVLSETRDQGVMQKFFSAISNYILSGFAQGSCVSKTHQALRALDKESMEDLVEDLNYEVTCALIGSITCSPPCYKMHSDYFKEQHHLKGDPVVFVKRHIQGIKEDLSINGNKFSNMTKEERDAIDLQLGALLTRIDNKEPIPFSDQSPLPSFLIQPTDSLESFAESAPIESTRTENSVACGLLKIIDAQRPYRPNTKLSYEQLKEAKQRLHQHANSFYQWIKANPKELTVSTDNPVEAVAEKKKKLNMYFYSLNHPLHEINRTILE